MNKPRTAGLSSVNVPKTVVQQPKHDDSQVNHEITPEMTQMAAVERLYSQRKPQVEKTDKAREDYEYERAGQECTFQPVIFSKRGGAVKPSSFAEITIQAHQPTGIRKEDDPEIIAQ